MTIQASTGNVIIIVFDSMPSDLQHVHRIFVCTVKNEGIHRGVVLIKELTTIPLSDLKRYIQSLVYKVFQKNRWKNLIITYRNAFFAENMKDGQHGFDYDEFMELFEFLIDNMYIKFGANVFKHIVGIPMGTNCAPLLANLYLFYHDFNF